MNIQRNIYPISVFILGAIAIGTLFQNCAKPLDLGGLTELNSLNLNFSTSDYSLQEGGAAQVVMARRGTDSSTINLDWNLELTAAADFNILSGTVSLLNGTNQVSFSLQSKDNAVTEGSRAYTLRVSDSAHPENYQTVMITVYDNDGPGNNANKGQVAAATQHSCAVINGGLKCWGRNYYGALGDGTALNDHSSYTFQQVSGMTAGVKFVSASMYNTCAIQNTGTGDGLYCWGYNNGNYTLGTGVNGHAATPQPITSLSTGVTFVSTGHYTTCAIQTGHLYCWGLNNYGQVGIGGSTLTNYPGPQLVNISGVPNPNFTEVAVSASYTSYGHVCAIESGRLYCWGSNSAGQVGVPGAPAVNRTPQLVTGVGSNVKHVGTSGNHSCAVYDTTVDTGQLACWGLNNYGQLGDNTVTNKSTPQVIIQNGVKDVALGEIHSCALMVDGSVKCWGYNDYGQIGIGNTAAVVVRTPSDVSGLTPGLVNITDLVSSQKTICAIDRAGATAQLKCWGANDYGQVGAGSNSPNKYIAPVNIP